MIWRPAYYGDLLAVMANLSDQHRAEYEKFGHPGVTFDGGFKAAYARGDAHCLVFEDAPQAFLIVYPYCGRAMCWFGATKKAFNRHHEMTRSGRKHLRRMADRHGQLTAVTASDHPMADRWIELLGFRRTEGLNDLRVFSYA